MTYAFDELRKHRIEAQVFDGNAGSQRIWDKLEFDHEAVHHDAVFIDGDFADVHRYVFLEDKWNH